MYRPPTEWRWARSGRVMIGRTHSTVTTSTKATSTTQFRCRSESSVRTLRSACTSSVRRAFPRRPTSVPYPRHVTSSCGTPCLALSSTAATSHRRRSTGSSSSTTVSTNTAGDDHFFHSQPRPLQRATRGGVNFAQLTPTGPHNSANPERHQKPNCIPASVCVAGLRFSLIANCCSVLM